MKALNFIVLSGVALVLTACGTSKTREEIETKVFDYKAPPVKAPSLEVPPELTSYGGDDRYSIPGESESGTSYSEYTKGGENRRANSVLPVAKNVRLERKDNQRWLLVNDRAENVWPVVKSFWQENGLVIKIENPQAGVIETDWSENRAKIPTDGFRRIVGSVLDSLFSSGEKDQFHTRLERSKDGNSTEIYITHYGQHEVQEKNETGFRWLPRPNDPELEATMLQLLMSRLAGGSGILDNKKKLPVTTASETVAAPKLNKLEDGSQSILLSEPFDKSWRKVGLALEQARMLLADKDRSKGIYYLSTGKEDSKTKLGADNVVRIHVYVREIGSGCEVVVSKGGTSSNDETRKIVEELYKALGRI
jgi:outer membrane protein assembly factor BamC